MIVAYILFFLFLVFCVLELNTNLKIGAHDIRFLFILMSVLFLLLLQYIVQSEFNDYLNYTRFFAKVEPIDEVISGNNYYFQNPEISFEIGYKYLNSIFKAAIDNEFFYLLVLNLTTIVIFWIFIYRNAYYGFFVFLAYYSIIYPSFQLGILRQSIANALFICAIPFLYNRCYYKYYLIISLAVCFHTTALLLFLFPLFANRQFSMKIIVLFFIIGNAFYFLNIDIIRLLFQGLLSFEDSSVTSSILYYLDSTYENNFLGIGFWDRTLQFVIICFIYNYLLNVNKMDGMTRLFLNISLFSLFLQLYSFNYPIFTNRLRFYFSLFIFLLIDKYISISMKKTNKVIFIFYSLLYCFVMFHISTSYLREID